MLYRLQAQQRGDSWVRSFSELHETFWEDETMQVVRSWLSCRAAYLEVMPTFRKRRLIAEGKRDAKDLSKEEYASIEKMDKFLNFLLRIVTVNPAFAGQQNLWNWLYADYWLEQLYEEELSELMWYTREFYPELLQKKEAHLS